MTMYLKEPWLQRKLLLLVWNLRELNLLGYLPWTVALALVYFMVRYRKTDESVALKLQWAAMGFLYLFFMVLLSPQPTRFETFADVRYLICAMPFFAGCLGAFLWFLHRFNRYAAFAAFLILISCNAATISTFNRQFRWFLPAYIAEVHREYPTAYRAVSRFLREKADRDDTFFAYPYYSNYPLMFYVGDRLKLCCTLFHDSHLPEKTVRELGAPLYFEENEPVWFISFGSHEMTGKLLDYFSEEKRKNGRIVRHKYELMTTLDVYWYQSNRPEIIWHKFGPKKDYDRTHEAVYIFKRMQ